MVNNVLANDNWWSFNIGRSARGTLGPMILMNRCAIARTLYTRIALRLRGIGRDASRERGSNTRYLHGGGGELLDKA